MQIEKQRYGWLSPTGEFTPSPWNTHEDYAERICEKWMGSGVLGMV